MKTDKSNLIKWMIKREVPKEIQNIQAARIQMIIDTQITTQKILILMKLIRIKKILNAIFQVRKKDHHKLIRFQDNLLMHSTCQNQLILKNKIKARQLIKIKMQGRKLSYMSRKIKLLKKIKKINLLSYLKLIKLNKTIS